MLRTLCNNVDKQYYIYNHVVPQYM